MEGTGLVAFSFGVPETIWPNFLIGEIASRKAKECSIPVYTQADVPLRSGIEVTRIKEVSGRPPPTLRTARGAVWWAVSREFHTLYTAAARPHLLRCLRDLEYAVKEARANIRVIPCEKIYCSPLSLWFCPESRQWRTRSPRNWMVWTFIVGALPLPIYTRIAA